VRIVVRLEEQALKCAQQVSLCQTPEAARIMRLLMIDVLIALRAESERIAERKWQRRARAQAQKVDA
jgi:hypothetical protein